MAFIEYMLWCITERQVIYRLYKTRRRRSTSRRVVGNISYSTNQDDYIRQNYGLKKDEFTHKLFREEFKASPLNVWFKVAYTKLRPIYYEHFFADLKEVLATAIAQGHIKESVRPEGVFIKEDMEYARQTLSPFYYPKKLLEYEPLRDLIIKVLKVVVLAFLGYTGLTAILHYYV